jgi:hypothetical protein
MDEKFTELLKTWLESPEDTRSYETGANLLLRITGNAIMFRSLLVNLERKKDFITYQLQKYYNFRVQKITHEQVEQMVSQVQTIADEHSLPATQQEAEASENNLEANVGKRPDHDLLPTEIQALYVENLGILRRMRELHLRLRLMTNAEGFCPDSDRYPFVSEIIELDRQYHANFKAYDEYQILTETKAETTTKAKKKSSKKK